MNINLIEEKIALNILRKSNQIYEEYGEYAAEEYLNSLSEQEASLLKKYGSKALKGIKGLRPVPGLGTAIGAGFLAHDLYQGRDWKDIALSAATMAPGPLGYAAMGAEISKEIIDSGALGSKEKPTTPKPPKAETSTTKNDPNSNVLPDVEIEQPKTGGEPSSPVNKPPKEQPTSASDGSIRILKQPKYERISPKGDHPTSASDGSIRVLKQPKYERISPKGDHPSAMYEQTDFRNLVHKIMKKGHESY